VIAWHRAKSALAFVAVVACVGSVSAATASVHSLGKGQARSAANQKAYDFERVRSWLDSYDTRQCKRRTARRVDCITLLAGETERRRFKCQLVIAVRAVYRRFYWDEAARIARSRCRSRQLSFLTYSEAQNAIQGEADRFAGQPTSITSLRRVDRQTYSGSAKWQRVNPTGCAGCGYDSATEQSFDTPASEYCSVDLKATLPDGGPIELAIEESACF
jgi:hypothetical protein